MSDTLTQYRKLHDGLSDMIEGGRLTVDDIPDDYRWLVESLADLAADDACVDTLEIDMVDPRVECPACGAFNDPNYCTLGTMGLHTHYRCRACGWDFHAPAPTDKGDNSNV